jgi:hypothetical protein
MLRSLRAQRLSLRHKYGDRFLECLDRILGHVFTPEYAESVSRDSNLEVP